MFFKSFILRRLFHKHSPYLCLIFCILFYSVCVSIPAQEEEKFFSKERSYSSSSLDVKEQNKPYGEYTIAFVLHAKDTGEPISHFVVHGVIIHQTVNKEEIETEDKVRLYRNIVGRLESKKMDHPEGECVYENLPEGKFLFDIHAPGFAPYQRMVTVPEDGEIILVELTRGGMVKGRLVDAVDRRPISEMNLALNYDNRDTLRSLHPSQKTDGDGYFCIPDLPLGTYIPSFPDIRDNFLSWKNSFSRDKAGLIKPEDLLKEYESALDKAYNKIYYIAPELEPFQLEQGGSVDLGTIALHRIPVLELEIVREDGTPLSFFPFVIKIRKEQDSYSNSYNSKTDDSGKHKVPLFGFNKAKGVEIFVPEEMAGTYRIKESEEKDKEPFAARQPHPNAQIIYPKPDENIHVRMVYHPMPHDMNLVFLVRDKQTHDPITQFQGFLSTQSDLMQFFYMDFALMEKKFMRYAGLFYLFFHSRNISGKVSLQNIPLPENFINNMNNWKDQSDMDRHLRLNVGIVSPGYVRQIFEIPINKTQIEKEFIFELEREATATGRLVVAGTSDPLTTETLGILLSESRNSDLSEKDQRFRPPDERFVEIMMINELLEGGFDPSRTLHFKNMAGARIDAKGVFTVKELRPHDKWALRISIQGFPEHLESDIKLKPGLNDLGDIPIGMPGKLEGLVKNEKGKPVAKSAFRFPLQSMTYAYDQNMETDGSGAFSFLMNFLSQDKQIVRVIPPWGASTDEMGSIENPFLWYDAVMELNRLKRREINPVIHQGNNLRLEIPITSSTLQIVDYYSKPENIPFETPSQSRVEEKYFGVRSVSLVALEPTREGFIYHHNYTAPPETGRFTTQTLTLQIPHVPPGPLALKVDGTQFQVFDDQSSDKKEPQETGGIPILFTRFEMPPTTHTLTLVPDQIDVEVALSNPPKGESARNLENLMFTFERVSPVTTGLGGDVQRILKQMASASGKTPESYMSPLVGYVGNFMRIKVDASYEPVVSYRPMMFRFVPEGEYIIRVYSSIFSMIGIEPKPYFEKKFTLSKPGEKTVIEVPYIPPAPREGVEPLVYDKTQ